MEKISWLVATTARVWYAISTWLERFRPITKGEKMYTTTRTLSYRQELDILEDLESALNDCANVEETVYEVADQWPEDAYNLRVIQWLQAGSPDLDETSSTDGCQDARELVGADSYNSVSKSIHAMLGAVLHGMALDYIHDVIDIDTSPWACLDKVRQAIMEHRADLMQHDGHAMTPPYQFGVFHSFDKDYTIHVTARA
jgi:hypothetical protein